MNVVEPLAGAFEVVKTSLPAPLSDALDPIASLTLFAHTITQRVHAVAIATETDAALKRATLEAEEEWLRSLRTHLPSLWGNMRDGFQTWTASHRDTFVYESEKKERAAKKVAIDAYKRLIDTCVSHVSALSAENVFGHLPVTEPDRWRDRLQKGDIPDRFERLGLKIALAVIQKTLPDRVAGVFATLEAIDTHPFAGKKIHALDKDLKEYEERLLREADRRRLSEPATLKIVAPPSTPFWEDPQTRQRVIATLKELGGLPPPIAALFDPDHAESGVTQRTWEWNELLAPFNPERTGFWHTIDSRLHHAILASVSARESADQQANERLSTLRQTIRAGQELASIDQYDREARVFRLKAEPPASQILHLDEFFAHMALLSRFERQEQKTPEPNNAPPVLPESDLRPGEP